ncbi:hypothetical protein BZA77DRAFT_342458 [Pyronema omphalodes]|nr:hypothetical protein BZA77DRAFT_342458 [Pyronema omphalodes]
MKLLSVFLSLIIAAVAIQDQFLEARNEDFTGLESGAASQTCIRRGSKAACRGHRECCAGAVCYNRRCRRGYNPFANHPRVVERETTDDVEGVDSNDIEAGSDVAFCDVARCKEGYVCKDDQCVLEEDIIEDFESDHLEARQLRCNNRKCPRGFKCVNNKCMAVRGPLGGW